MAWEAFQGVEQLADLDTLNVIADPEVPAAETAAQVKTAVAAAKAVIKSGKLGEWENLHVFLSGHANPAHAPTGGQHDTISVSVSVAKYKN